MSWLGRILVLILVFLLVGLIRSFVGRVLAASRARKRTGNRARKTISGQMVKDPQCGMYVATDLAVTARVKGDTLYFCSEECRNSFIANR